MASTDTNQNGILQAIDFRLDEALIIGASGRSVDIRPIIEELNVFEDLFSPCITGNLIVTDSNDLINKVPLTGFEYLSLSFSKPSQKISYSKIFRVYKITDRKQNSDQNEFYTIHFCSEEFILNESLRVSKTYLGKSIHQIVQDIATTYLKIDSTKFPKSQSTETTGIHDIVIPNWQPFYAINWLSRMALSSTYTGASYVFFENRDGFYFTPIEELCKKAPIQQLLNSKIRLGFETDKQTSDIQSAQETVTEYEFHSTFDMMRTISSGMYAGTLITVDPMRQRITNIPVTSESVFPKTSHLNTNNLVSQALTRRDLPVDKEFQSFYRVYPTTQGHEQLAYNPSTNLHANRVEQWLLQRNMYLSGLHTNRLNVSIPGNVQLTVGETVDVRFPAIIAQSGVREFDKLYSGKYLITALRHSINKFNHFCYLEISKDSSEVKLPTTLQTDTSIKKIKTL
jgi:hypothetical protein